MLIGAMNHPGADVVGEIEWMGRMGLGFVDLTLEPPAATAKRVDVPAIRKALERYGMQVVGHTAYYLPLASPFESLRRAAVAELAACAEVFCAVGAKWMNVHPDRHTPFHPRAFYLERNLLSMREVLQVSQRCGLGLMIENLPGDFNTAEQMGELLGPMQELGLHLDIGHANLLVPHNTTEEILQRWGSRLRHVHLHDNKGGHNDLHLPLGCGTVDYRRAVRALKRCGYDGTITLEVFTPDRHFFEYSCRQLQVAWDEAN